MDMAELTSMMNIGKEMARKLEAVGIESAEKLLEAGSQQAFLKLKGMYPQVCLVHLYALEGAVENVEFNSLSKEKKKELKGFSDFWRKEKQREFRKDFQSNRQKIQKLYDWGSRGGNLYCSAASYGLVSVVGLDLL